VSSGQPFEAGPRVLGGTINVFRGVIFREPIIL
jgi:hypothetical protein